MKTWLFFLKDYRKSVFTIISLFFLTALFEGFSFSLFMPLMFVLLRENSISGLEQLPPVISYVFKPFLLLPSEKVLLVLFLVLFTGVIVKNVLLYFATCLNVKFRLHFGLDIKKKIFRKFLRVPYQKIINESHGTLVHDLYEISENLSIGAYSLIAIIGKSLMLFVLICLLALISIELTLIVFVVFLVFGFFFKKLSVLVDTLSSKRAKMGIDEMSFCSNVLQGLKQVTIFNAGETTSKKYVDLIKNRADSLLKINYVKGLTPSLTEIGIIFCVFILGFSAHFLSMFDSEVIISVLLSYLGIIARIVPTLNYLSSDYLSLKSIRPYILRALKIFEEPEIKNEGRLIFNNLNKSVVFDNINFNYTENNLVLHKLNLTFKKGQTTAIVGPSGAGKSTIIDLVAGIIKPSAGKILIDNKDLQELDIYSWYDKLGYITQDTFIFHGSIKENIAFSKPEATFSEIQLAAKKAGAEEFINELPNKYDTLVGERGMKLSGGQRQRIAIARAMLKNPEIYLFDEATSSLDNLSEKFIQKTIKELGKDKTVIIVAHRLSTITDSDKIFFLKNCHVTEEGTHEELLAKKGDYWKFYQKKD